MEEAPDPNGKVWERVGPMDYLVPGFLGLVMASIGFISLPVHIATYRELSSLLPFRRLNAADPDAPRTPASVRPISNLQR
jgi:hypothetical protein